MQIYVLSFNEDKNPSKTEIGFTNLWSIEVFLPTPITFCFRKFIELSAWKPTQQEQQEIKVVEIVYWTL